MKISFLPCADCNAHPSRNMKVNKYLWDVHCFVLVFTTGWWSEWSSSGCAKPGEGNRNIQRFWECICFLCSPSFKHIFAASVNDMVPTLPRPCQHRGIWLLPLNLESSVPFSSLQPQHLLSHGANQGGGLWRARGRHRVSPINHHHTPPQWKANSADVID